MKPMRSILPVLVVAILLGASCTAPTPAPTTTPPVLITQEPPVPVATVSSRSTIVIWHQWDERQLAAISAVFNDYEKQHPGVTIQLFEPGDMTGALSTAIPAGEGPDIVAWTNDQIGSLAQAGEIVALGAYKIDRTFLTGTYEPVAVQGTMVQNQIWALPETQEGIALVYNKRLVTDAYLPRDPTNFDDLLARAKAFMDHNPGKYLVCNEGLGNNDAYYAAPIYFGFGVPALVDSQGKAYLNTPQALQAATWIDAFRPYAPQKTSHEICKTMLAEGQAGIWWTGPSSIPDIQAAQVDYGIQAMGRPFVRLHVSMLTPNAADRGHAAEAVDVMKYFTSAAVQKTLALANQTIPAASEALNDPEVQQVEVVAGFGAALKLGVPLATTPLAAAQWGPLADATSAIWTGKESPQAALAAAQKAIESQVAGMQ